MRSRCGRVIGAAVTSRRLVAFFGCLHYSALRPSEALALRFHSDAEIAGRWTDDGHWAARQFMHRAHGTVRHMRCPPDLVALLHAHLPGPAPGGRLFYGPCGGTITSATYDLRHTVVSGWLVSAVDSALDEAWAGHSVAVRHRVYAHVVKGREGDAKRRIAEFLREETMDGSSV